MGPAPEGLTVPNMPVEYVDGEDEPCTGRLCEAKCFEPFVPSADKYSCYCPPGTEYNMAANTCTAPMCPDVDSQTCNQTMGWGGLRSWSRNNGGTIEVRVQGYETNTGNVRCNSGWVTGQARCYFGTYGFWADYDESLCQLHSLLFIAHHSGEPYPNCHSGGPACFDCYNP